MAGLIFLSGHDTVFATGFESLANNYTYTNTTPGAPYDSTAVYEVNGAGGLNAGACGVQPGSQDDCDSNFGSVVTFTPPDYYIAHGTDLPIGAVVGILSSNPTTLANGAAHTDCDQGITVTFNPLINSSIDTQDTIDPLPPGTPNRFLPLSQDVDPANGIPDGADRWPSFLSVAFDPDGPAGDAQPLVPRARYFGIVQVLGDWIPLQFLVFNPGQLQASFTGDNSALGQFGSAFGYGSVTVLSDPTSPLAPSSITDFCAPLTTTTTLLGTTADNSATAGTDESGFIRAKNPPANTGIQGTGSHLWLTFAASLRNADNDPYENALDTCPFATNVGNPRDNTQGLAGGDTDNDGIDNACDTTISTNTNNFDHDNDIFENRQDNCPQDFNPGQNAATDGGPREGTPSNTSPVPGPADGGTAGMGIGDACQTGGDSDWDGDGDLNAADNCTWLANASQTDTDGDGTGDVCDPVAGVGSTADVDGDGDLNSTGADNCALRANSSQTDTDGDGIGDACDPQLGVAENDIGAAFDFDVDGLCNPGTGPDTTGVQCSGIDNCPITNNLDQLDADGDGIGNSCDPSPGLSFALGHYHAALIVQAVCIPASNDTDGDGWCDATESALGSGLGANSPNDIPEDRSLDFPMPVTEAGAAIQGTASNGVAGICTDGVNNDGDGSANDSDTECSPQGGDADDDSIADGSDNCSSNFNPSQTNTDARNAADGFLLNGSPLAVNAAGDACQSDSDSDGTSDVLEYFLGTDPLVSCNHSVTGVSHDSWAPDTSRNGTVNAGDFGGILASWQLTAGTDAGYTRRADLSGNGTVNAGDFGAILANWQNNCTTVNP